MASADECTAVTFDEPLLKQLSSVVEKTYINFQRRKDEFIHKRVNEIKDRYFQLDADALKKRHSLPANPMLIDFCLVPQPPMSVAKLKTRRNILTGQSYELPVRLMPEQEALPRMHQWIATQQNVAADEQQMLTHIPFAAFDSPQETEGFIRSLQESFDHIHGVTETAEFDHLNDSLLSTELFPELILDIWREFDKLDLEGVEKLQPFEGELTAQEPPPIIFRAFAVVFKDHGNELELYNKYISTLGRLSVKQKSECFPDIDGPEAISATADKAMHTHHTLYCSRCFIYDCFLHTERGRPTHKGSLKKHAQVKEQEGPCSEHCYKLDYPNGKTLFLADSGNESSNDGFAVASTSKTNVRSNEDASGNKRKAADLSSECGAADARGIGRSKKQKLWPEERELTPKEQTLFRVLYPIFKPNFCVIAQNLFTPTCKQVFKFAMSEREKDSALDDSIMAVDKSPPPKRGKRTAQLNRIHKLNAQQNAEGSKALPPAYLPCKHRGHCGKDVEDCNCARKGTFCEKFCACSRHCAFRFPGCQCTAYCNTRACPCFIAARECDPDVCVKCDAGELDRRRHTRCKNNKIQRGMKHGALPTGVELTRLARQMIPWCRGIRQPHDIYLLCLARKTSEHLLLAPSDIAGWGIFNKDPIRKGDMVAEYCGELISQNEAERRGKLYDFDRCSFLFNLDQESVVDATCKGNKIRFANHSGRPNLGARVKLVNGDRRISILAVRDIAAGEELFFDYRYGPKEVLKFVNLERYRAKNAKAVLAAMAAGPSTSKSMKKNRPSKSPKNGANVNKKQD